MRALRYQVSGARGDDNRKIYGIGSSPLFNDARQ